MAVAQHGVAIAEAENLVQPMRDEDDRQAFGLQRPHDADEICNLGFAQSRGRLVHDDEPGLHGERASDLDELLLGDGKIAHLCHWIALEPDALGYRLRLLSHAPPAYEQLRAGLAANEHVLGDRHVRGEGELLVDRDDSSALGVVGRRKSDRLTEQLDFARIGALRAGQNLEQRRLASAVLAQERMDLRRSDFEMNVLERTHAGKALADAGHLEDGPLGAAVAERGGWLNIRASAGDEPSSGAMARKERSLSQREKDPQARRETARSSERPMGRGVGLRARLTSPRPGARPP